jgi:hypothetical protein
MMARLYRPHVPVEVKCRVVLRQLGEMFVDQVLADARTAKMSLGSLLAGRLSVLADLLKCEIAELRLDHDPPLAAREIVKTNGRGQNYYKPMANDPEYLNYRPHGAQHEGSHDVKTRIRGDHGQFSDVALIKRQRRRERVPKPKRGPKIKSRGFGKPNQKQKWASRPFDRRK